ncbi:MAG: hypothetical protein KAY37_16535 [Phycisphaerae bacterium]|nr:hypothetical protein [Phycisphaerae bacterium]
MPELDPGPRRDPETDAKAAKRAAHKEPSVPEREASLRMQEVVRRSAVVDIKLRIAFFVVIALLFITLNAVVIWLVYTLVKIDHELLTTAGVAEVERVVDSKVLMSLIGATAVQVGAVIFAITKYLFDTEKSVQQA